MIPEWVCPRCGKHSTAYPSRSRLDNATQICSECGNAEGIADFARQPLSFDEWKFPPGSVWQRSGFGDGPGVADEYVQFLRFTRECKAYVHLLASNKDVPIGLSVFVKFFRLLPREEGNAILVKSDASRGDN